MVIKQELKLYVMEAAYASVRLSVEIHPVFHIELLKQIFYSDCIVACILSRMEWTGGDITYHNSASSWYKKWYQ